MKTDNYGRSMLEMLGVLAVIGILSIVGIAGYSKSMTSYKVEKTANLINKILFNYNSILNGNIKDIDIKGVDGIKIATESQLIDQCDVESSQIDGYDVCKVPLGEIYIKISADDDFYNEDSYRKYKSYMLFVSLLYNPHESCVQLLNYPWQKTIPPQWWNTGLVWVTYNGEKYKVIDFNNKNTIFKACKNMCNKYNKHCTIVFDFASKIK